MTGLLAFYFPSIVFTFVITGVLVWVAWQHPPMPGVRVFALMALDVFLMAMVEIFSMISPQQEQALFWSNVRSLFVSFLPVLYVVFAVRYHGQSTWLSVRVLVALCVIPFLTQVIIWTNGLHHLWAIKDVFFTHNGALWISLDATLIPGIWYMVDAIYSLLLLLIAAIVILIEAWNKKGIILWQSILLSTGSFVAIALSLIPLFGLFPNLNFNILIPGLGIISILYSLAIFRFRLLKTSIVSEVSSVNEKYAYQEKRSLAFLLVIYAVIVTGIATIGYFSYKTYTGQLQQQVEYQLDSIANLKINGLNEWRIERQGDAEAVSKNPTFPLLAQVVLSSPDDSTASQAMQSWLDTLKKAYTYNRILFIDAKGMVRISSPKDDVAVTPHLLESVNEALLSGETTWTDFHRHEDGSIHLTLTAPIFAGQDLNQPLGTVVFEIDPNIWLYPYLQEWPTVSETAETLLVRQEGDEAVFLNSTRFDPDAALNLRLPTSQSQVIAVKAILGTRGLVEGLDYRGQPVVSAVYSVPDSPWILIARMDKAEIYAPARTRLWQTVVFFGFLILATGSSLGLFWRRNRMREYQHQLKAAEALRESEEKYSTLFSNMGEGVALHELIYDDLGKPTDYIIQDVNPKYETMLGISREQAINQPATKVYGTDQAPYLEVYAKVTATGEPVTLETYFPPLKKHFLISAVSPSAQHFATIFTDITKRKQAEMDLVKKGIEYKTLAENSPDLIARFDRQLRHIYVNTAAASAGNLSAEGYIGKTMAESGVEEPLSLIWEKRFKQVFETGKMLEVEDSFPTPTGVQIFQTYLIPEKNTDGNVDSLLSIARNITERKQAELSLNETKNYLNNLISYANAPIITWDSDMRITLFNHAFEHMTGYEFSNVIGEKLSMLFPDESIVESLKAIKRTSKGEFWESVEIPVKCQNGETRIALWNSANIFGSDGKTIIATIAQGQDITDRKQIVQDLVRSEERYRNLMEDAPVGIAVHSNGEIIFSNAAYARLLGAESQKQIIGKNIQEIIHPERLATLLERIQKMTTDKSGFIPIEDKFIRLDGTLIDVELTATPLVFEGRPAVQLIVSDISERIQAETAIKEYSQKLEQTVEERTRDLKSAQERLLRQERLAALGQLAGSIAHELRNPLGVISNATAYLSMIQPEADEKVREYIEIIQSETRTSEKIISDLMDYARLQTVERKPAEISEIIRNAQTRNPTPEHIKVSAQVPAGLPPVLVNATQIEQVIGNLLTNAYQAMPTTGNLLIKAELSNMSDDEDCVKVTVKDNGDGIKQDDIERIFEPLFTTKVKGIGLGLAVSKKIVDANHGRIEVESLPGKGSTFTLYLPTQKETK